MATIGEVSIVTDPTLEALVLDLLEWLASGAKPYADVMNNWKTSCPRFPVWEEVVDRGFVTRVHSRDVGPCVTLTSAGLAHLRKARSPK